MNIKRVWCLVFLTCGVVVRIAVDKEKEQVVLTSLRLETRADLGGFKGCGIDDMKGINIINGSNFSIAQAPPYSL